MRQRAPLVLSSAALVVAVLGSTPIGHAAGERLAAGVPFAKTAGFAKNAGNASKLNGRRSTLSGTAGTIPVVGKNGKLPEALGAVGARGPEGARGPQGPPGPAGGGGGSGPTGAAGGDLAGKYPNPQVAANAIGTAQVADNSLTGNDLNEGTLDQVPSAVLGGLGRSGDHKDSACDPESLAFVPCGSVSLTLPKKTRVLVVARIEGQVEADADTGFGECRLGTSATGDFPDSRMFFHVISGHGSSGSDNAALVFVTPPVGPGNVSFRVDCSQRTVGAITYAQSSVTALAISPG